jgi:iron-sulfur cluster assembly protein
MFTLSTVAAEQVSRAAQEQPDNPALRVAAKFDVDGELVYGMGFDSERDDDLILDIHGIRVLIAPPSQSLLDEATLDFVEVQSGEFQFIFTHTNPPFPMAGACGSGGCGSCGTKSNSCS